MTVFVDDWRQEAHITRHRAIWSHLTVGPFDDLAELHELAQRIGLRKSWFQPKPWPRAHYDVTDTRRAAAIKAGAVPISWRDAGVQRVWAKEAWRAVAGDLAPARTPAGKPPGRDDLWAAAAALVADWSAERAEAIRRDEEWWQAFRATGRTVMDRDG